ncbi:MAG: nucleotidyltransferase substrate binding protein [Candidatus Kapaibacteriales bacterium]
MDEKRNRKRENYKKAFSTLSKLIELENPSLGEKMGIIKAFELTFELGWNVLRDMLVADGQSGMQGSRDVIRNAYDSGMIESAEDWLDAVSDRIKTAHTYDEDLIEIVIDNIHSKHFEILSNLWLKLVNK